MEETLEGESLAERVRGGTMVEAKFPQYTLPTKDLK